MTNVFFTADLHFCHENIIKFNNRPFADYQEMNEALIANWNSIVTRKDTVYLLGDIGMGKRPELVNCISRLNGHIHWVIGNHDRKCCKWPEMKSKFTWMGDYKEINIHDPGTSYRGSSRTRIVAFHYPIASWNGMHHGSWHIHGHTHGTFYDPNNKQVDIGVDCWNYFPVSYDQLKQYMSKKEFIAVDGHGRKGPYMKGLR